MEKNIFAGELQILNNEDCKKKGIEFDGRKMPNGEYRFKLSSKFDGSSYIRTEMTSDVPGAWQNAHFHKGIVETYVVQEGWIASAGQKNEEVKVKIYKSGEVFTTEIGIAHNIFMSPGTTIHTIKHGKVGDDFGNPEKGGTDWWPALNLDVESKKITEENLLKLI